MPVAVSVRRCSQSMAWHSISALSGTVRDWRGVCGRTWRRGLAVSAVAAVAFWQMPAQAARPMNTDDARIVDAKACQLETWAKRHSSSLELWAQPACNFTGNLELTVGGALTRADGHSRTSGQMMQGKTLFKTMEPNGWGIGLAMGVSRDPEAGSGHDWYGYVPTSFSWADDRMVIHTNVGWVRQQGTRRTHATWGIGVEAQVLSRTWLIAESFAQAGQGRPFYQVGVRHWLVPNRVQIDATIGNRFGGGNVPATGGATNERWVSIGLRLLTDAFLP
jgi:hypothetical protein